jgi:hypothetical protein
VGHFDLNATQRVLYYDPYDYSSALIMRVKNDVTDWSTANEVSFTYETVQTHVVRTGATSETQTLIGYDETDGGLSSIANSVSHETTKEWINEINTENGYGDDFQTGWVSEQGYAWGTNRLTEIGAELGTENDILVAKAITNNAIEETDSHYYNEQTYNLRTHVESGSLSILAGENSSDTWNDSKENRDESSWSIAKRFEKATGSSTTNENEWSTSTSISVTTTYLAQYFNEEGSPLSWKIVQYAVFMPLRYELQTKVGTEWLTVYNGYSLITPIQGTCRAYMRNNVAYIEDYGTGLPVTWDDFWSRFYTTESLKAAYATKLYPDNN